MNSVEIVKQKQRLDALFNKVRDLDHDTELQSHWSRYLCILVYGFIENSIRHLLVSYAENKADPRVAKFVVHRLQRFQNAKMGNILDLIGHFSNEWKEEFEQATDGELKDAIDSVVNNRHSIAHGRSVGISYVTMRDYYTCVITVVELLETQLST